MVVRYCTRFTGDRFAAEDLAQQALLEAWLKSSHLPADAARNAWLLGMAHNVCLRWARSQGRALARLVRLAEPAGGVTEQVADDLDLEMVLERAELARLLDQAMALLPAETREVLIQKYIMQTSQREVAARLGLTEGAVEARLLRGKRALRRLLTTSLRAEAVTYGLLPSTTNDWQETRIWCPDCGHRRLAGRFAPGRDLQLDCPDCCGRGRVIQVRGWVTDLLGDAGGGTGLLDGVTGYKPALNRIVARLRAFYEPGIVGRQARCRWCGRLAPVRTGPEDVSGEHDVQTACAQCGQVSGISTVSAVASLRPEVQAFLREQRRVRTLPCQHSETEGVPAIVARFQSITGSAALTVVLAQETLQAIGVS